MFLCGNIVSIATYFVCSVYSTVMLILTAWDVLLEGLDVTNGARLACGALYRLRNV
jgi:hypothetical protein